MPQLENEKKQEELLDILATAIDEKSVSTTYLLTGLRSGGVAYIAESFAHMLNCAQKPWQNGCACAHCRKIDHVSHPDVRIFGEDSEKKTLEIDMVRQLQSWLSFKPFEAEWKVAIIYDAERFSLPAQNALLKTLEEPPEHSIIILTTAYILQLLPTIVSRSTEYRLRSYTLNDIEQKLREEYETMPALSFVATCAQGSIDRAREICESNLLSLREEFLDAFTQGKSETFFNAYERASNEDLKSILASIIMIMRTILRDLMVLAADEAAKTIINADYRGALVRMARSVRLHVIQNGYAECTAIERASSAYGNVKLLLTRFLLLCDQIQ